MFVGRQWNITATGDKLGHYRLLYLEHSSVKNFTVFCLQGTSRRQILHWCSCNSTAAHNDLFVTYHEWQAVCNMSIHCFRTYSVMANISCLELLPQWNYSTYTVREIPYSQHSVLIKSCIDLVHYNTR